MLNRNWFVSKLIDFRDGEELKRYVVGARKVLAAVASYCQVSNSFRFCFKRKLFGDYHPEESKKNKAFVVPVQSQLASVGVEGHVGQAGYYFMPDFEILRPALAVRWTLKELSQIRRTIFQGHYHGAGNVWPHVTRSKGNGDKINKKHKIAGCSDAFVLIFVEAHRSHHKVLLRQLWGGSPCSTCHPVVHVTV